MNKQANISRRWGNTDSYFISSRLNGKARKQVCEFPLSGSSRLQRQRKKKMAARNTSSHKKWLQSSRLSAAGASQELPSLTASEVSRPDEYLSRTCSCFFILSSARSRNQKCECKRKKNGDGRAGPAFYQHVTRWLEGEVGGGNEDWLRKWGVGSWVTEHGWGWGYVHGFMLL